MLILSQGTCTTTGVCGALTELNGQDGAGQMAHFTNTDGFNLYRLPVGWQYLVNDVLGGPLDPNYSGDYDKLVQACLATGSHCLIDIHNYARWNGAIIGQGGPTNDQFASLWSQLATKYASESKVLFGLMNEPHDCELACSLIGASHTDYHDQCLISTSGQPPCKQQLRPFELRAQLPKLFFFQGTTIRPRSPSSLEVPQQPFVRSPIRMALRRTSSSTSTSILTRMDLAPAQTVSPIKSIHPSAH